MSWTFLIWGLLHGTALAAFRLWQVFRKRTMPAVGGFAAKAGAGILTFHFVLLGWIFFRAASVETALKMLGQIGSLKFSFENTTPAFLLVLLLAAAAHFVPKAWYDIGLLQFTRTPAFVQAAALALLLIAIRLVSATGAAPFIYSKF